MTIWIHREAGDTSFFRDFSGQCRFCERDLAYEQIEDRWPITSEEIAELHRDAVLGMAEVLGDFILKEMELLCEPEIEPVFLYTCSLCGWWHVSKQIYLTTKTQYWTADFGASAALHTFNTADITIPAEEVRQYLAARYEDRFNVHPRRFEEVVASVFSSHGFRSELTSYSNDGGIDVILRDTSDRPIAIQVKRYKGAIKVASIRELLGAMVLKGFTKGIFVTTSTFQTGALEAARAAEHRGIALELIDGVQFLNSLRTAQLIDFSRYPQLLQDDVLGSLKLTLGNECHLNSL